MLEDDNAISCFTDDLGATSWTDDNGLTLTCGAFIAALLGSFSFNGFTASVTIHTGLPRIRLKHKKR
jgi:hypothetical protein